MQLIAIAALTKDRVIGKDNKMLWHYPEDMTNFVSHTLYHGVVMGRKTFESIGKPLPKRFNMVITRSQAKIPGVLTASSIDLFLEVAKMYSSAGGVWYVIGGQEIYSQLLPYCTRLILTKVPDVVEGDTFFPEYEDHFQLTAEKPMGNCTLQRWEPKV